MLALRSAIFMFLLLALSPQFLAQKIYGEVKSKEGVPLPFVNISAENSTLGAYSNDNGGFELELGPGHFNILVSYVGYVSQRKPVVLERGKDLYVSFTLEEKTEELSTAEVVADSRDFAKYIMSNARKRRKEVLDLRQDFEVSMYAKVSLESEQTKFDVPDSVKTNPGRLERFYAQTDSLLDQKHHNLVEYLGTLSCSNLDQMALVYDAYEDHVVIKKYANRGASIGITVDTDPMPSAGTESRNPYLVYEDFSSANFDFYQNRISFDRISERPLLSPIADGSGLSYRFDYIETFSNGSELLYKLSVLPLFAEQPLFRGEITVRASDFSLVAVDLTLPKSAIHFCDELKVQQQYEEADHGGFYPRRRVVSYTISEGRRRYEGKAEEDFKTYLYYSEGIKDFSRLERKVFKDNALDRDSSFWMDNRPATLNNAELKFINRADSLSAYYESDEWYFKRDSAFNKIDIWTPFVGIGHRNSRLDREWYIGGILEQINPLGIGGYRHKLPGYISYRLPDEKLLRIDGFIDYGFANEDVKGKLSLGYTYKPEKFLRTKVTVGDYYEMINLFASISQLFSRSNYVRSRTFGISQRMELFNGFYVEGSFNYGIQTQIDSAYLVNDFTNDLFGTLNEPIEFNTYVKSEFRIDFEYRMGQSYMMRNGRKVLLGNDRPVITGVIRKGIPDLFGSEINYTYLELAMTHFKDVGRVGRINWKATAGGFVAKDNLRVLENKFFRGSDRFFFSNPAISMQLLAPIFNTPEPYLQANMIHHFEGFFLDKVPLINKLKLKTAAGAGILTIPEENFNHVEAFAGLEKDLRIKGQLFRLGLYGVTSKTSEFDQDYTIKLGINFFNSFTNNWDY